MQDEKELWSMTYVGLMMVQTLGRTINGTAITPGHVTDMDGASRAVADRIVETIKARFPPPAKPKGK